MRHCRDAEENDMIDLGSDHRSVSAHFRFPDTNKCDSQADDKKGKGTRKSTRFANQTGNTGEPVESITLQEERFLELEKRLTKKEAAAAPNEAERNGYQKEALHESASEAKKTLETSAKTAAANSHDEPPQQKTAAANEETEIHNSKIALTSHRSRKQLQQRSERQGSTRRQGRVIATRQRRRWIQRTTN